MRGSYQCEISGGQSSGMMDVNLRENIRVGASLLSALSFWWLKDLFTSATQRPITLHDLYDPLPEDKSNVLTSRLER